MAKETDQTPLLPLNNGIASKVRLYNPILKCGVTKYGMSLPKTSFIRVRWASEHNTVGGNQTIYWKFASVDLPFKVVLSRSWAENDTDIFPSSQNFLQYFAIIWFQKISAKRAIGHSNCTSKPQTDDQDGSTDFGGDLEREHAGPAKRVPDPDQVDAIEEIFL